MFKRVLEFQYAVEPNVGRYRAINRYLFEQAELLRDWIPDREVFAQIAALPGPEYRMDEFNRNVGFLIEHNNVYCAQDVSRARGVDDFLSRARMLQLTPQTIEIERMLLAMESSSRRGGSLDSTLLERLWSKLSALDAHLTARPVVPTREYLLRDARGTWNDAYRDFAQLRENATSFLLALSSGQAENITDLPAFLLYKKVVGENLRSFITDLMRCTSHIRILVEAWKDRGTTMVLIDDLAEAEHLAATAPDGVLPDIAVERERFHREYGALDDWFRRGGTVDVLQRSAAGASERIVRHASALAGREHGALGRRGALERVAAEFASGMPPEAAHRLAASALGSGLPYHFPNDWPVPPVRGGSAWAAAPYVVPLARNRRGPRTRAGSGAPILDRRGEQHRVMMEEWNRLTRLSALWDGLFASGQIELDGLRVEDPEVARSI
ncbi:MAG TPA: TIGR02677 family protein, partial [Longimicrobium sp.]